MYILLKIVVCIIVLKIIISIIKCIIRRLNYTTLDKSEITYYLDKILAFLGTEYIGKNFGLVMLIPVDDNGKLYSPKSNRIRFSILCYDESYLGHAVKVINEEGNFFKIGGLEDSDRNDLIAISMFEFNCPYKKQMKLVYEMMIENYPNLKLHFDASRIMFDNPFVLQDSNTSYYTKGNKKRVIIPIIVIITIILLVWAVVRN